MNKNKQTHLEL